MLARAAQDLTEARMVLAIGLSRSAARAAYYAAFHAAEAFIFERSSKIAKTHKGVRAEFSRLLRAESLAEPELTAFLSEGYGYKEIADYSFGERAEITRESAGQAIEAAKGFVARVEALIAGRRD